MYKNILSSNAYNKKKKSETTQVPKIESMSE